jgi:AcrR family transcriptional regulator
VTLQTVTSTSARILDAATTLFLEQGFDATSMEQVRLRAGVSNGSLYHHCPTKNHLARALYTEVLVDFHTALTKAIAGGTEAEAGVRALVAAHITWVVKHPQRARVLHELRRTTAIDGVEPDWGALNAEAFDALRRWCAREAAAGRMQALPFGVWMALVFGPLLQLTPQWARMPRPVVAPKLRAVLADAAWRAVQPEGGHR